MTVISAIPSHRKGAAVLSAALVLFLTGCDGGNPITSNRSDPVLIPGVFESALGVSTDQSVRKQYKTSSDAALTAYVQEVGRKMAAVCDRKDVAYDFTLLDDKLVNAFAVPGGHVYVTTGILRKMTDEAQLAAVLGHEVGHIVHRHGVKQLQRQFGVEALTVAISTFLLNPADREKKEAVEFAEKASSTLLLTANSRDDETQSDEAGIQYCYRAWYDPAAMVDVQKMLKGLRTTEPTLIEGLMSTHPMPDDRIAHAEAEVKKLPAAPRPYNRNADRYKQQVLAKLK